MAMAIAGHKEGSFAPGVVDQPPGCGTFVITLRGMCCALLFSSLLFPVSLSTQLLLLYRRMHVLNVRRYPRSIHTFSLLYYLTRGVAMPAKNKN